MKTLITTAVCSSLLVLAACNSTDSKQVSAETTTEQVKPAFAQTALASGISQANIDASVRKRWLVVGYRNSKRQNSYWLIL